MTSWESDTNSYFLVNSFLAFFYVDPRSCQCSLSRWPTVSVAYFSPLSLLFLLYLLLNMFKHYEICFRGCFSVVDSTGEHRRGESYLAMMSTFGFFCILFIVNLLCSKPNIVIRLGYGCWLWVEMVFINMSGHKICRILMYKKCKDFVYSQRYTRCFMTCTECVRENVLNVFLFSSRPSSYYSLCLGS